MPLMGLVAAQGLWASATALPNPVGQCVALRCIMGYDYVRGSKINDLLGTNRFRIKDKVENLDVIIDSDLNFSNCEICHQIGILSFKKHCKLRSLIETHPCVYLQQVPLLQLQRDF